MSKTFLHYSYSSFVQAIVSFTNQAMKGVSKTHQFDLLEKYQVVTKEDVLAALEKHFLPLFDPASSVAVVVTAPAKSDEISQWLKTSGFKVTQKVMDVDPIEMDNSEEDGSDDSSSEASR